MACTGKRKRIGRERENGSGGKEKMDREGKRKWPVREKENGSGGKEEMAGTGKRKWIGRYLTFSEARLYFGYPD